MKSNYILAILAGFFISNTLVTASDLDSAEYASTASDYEAESASGDAATHIDRIRATADEYEDCYDRTQSKKEKKRRVKEDRVTAERKAAIAALTAEVARKEKVAKSK
ncbi:hypothetical protein [Candidatus Bodocaedibacter vickermanii]|uniref:Uncharacterized protein n=1 Tax=Candidatus Bodocaedibacter vickermanii TaxID=2741701 RepID=A0A7L9RSX1_9PROT|nr:hypothetical protein CPBP_00277 [Candidatus Paracaedibacteraceae bacterium 'Lake Konstanz']